MQQHYLVTFSGQVEPGLEADTVAEALCRAMGRDSDYKKELLSGVPVILKRSDELAQAEQVLQSLKARGAIARIVTVDNPVQLSEQNQPADAQPVPLKAAGKISFGNEGAQTPAPCASLKKKFQYRFDTFMAKGSKSSFKALLFVFVTTFLVIAGLRGLLFLFNPSFAQQYESLDILGNAYLTFLQLTDPGNMAQDILSSPWYKLFAVVSGMLGLIMLSALIAVITTGLDQKLTDLKRGRSKVIEKNHTLIVGWDEQRILEILRELVLANESEADACVVILADKDKQEMDEILRFRFPKTGTTRIVTRSGKGTILGVLDTVSIESVKSVIVLAGCSDTSPQDAKTASDALVIQTVLAVTSKSVAKDDYAVVAEIYNDAYRDILDSTFPDYVVTLDAGNILAKLLVQTSRSVGLSVVYSEILSFDGCEMYFYEADWGTAKFAQLAYHFPDGVPIGVRQADGELIINPAGDYAMRADDEVLIIADDDSTIEYLAKPLMQPRSFPAIESNTEQQIERELIFGLNQKSETIIREFAEYVKEGSEIDVIVHRATEQDRSEIAQLDREIEHVQVRLIDTNPLNRKELLALDPGKYDNIIILASVRDDKDLQQVDSENIVILLLLRSIMQELDTGTKVTKLITEVLESQNQALIAKAGVKDMIISNQLISMVTAQISESPGMKDVYDNLFQEDGSEIYLKPLSLYFDSFPVEVCFGDLIAVAQNRDEVCFGIKIAALEDDQSQNNGVDLIPEKSTKFTLNAGDCLVVVAENEL